MLRLRYLLTCANLRQHAAATPQCFKTTADTLGSNNNPETQHPRPQALFCKRRAEPKLVPFLQAQGRAQTGPSGALAGYDPKKNKTHNTTTPNIGP